jgi:protease II
MVQEIQSVETDQVIAYIPRNESIEFVLVVSKETGLAVYVEKTKHIFMSRKQNAGHHNIHRENVSLVSVAKLKNMGTVKN